MRTVLLRSVGWVVLHCCCLLTGAALAADPTLWRQTDSQPASLVRFDGDKFDFQTAGEELQTTLAGFDRWGTWNDVARGSQVLLVDGSLLVGDVLRITDEKLVLGDAAGLGRCRFEGAEIPLAKIRGIVFQPGAEKLHRDKRLFAVESAKATADRVFLVGGETLTGLLLGSAGRESRAEVGTPIPIQFQVTGLTSPIDILPARIEALVLNPSLMAPVAEQPKFWLGLNDGNWLAVASYKQDERFAQIDLASEIRLRTPLQTDDEFTPQFVQAITYLEPRSSNVQYLSDLKPTSYKFIPFLTLDWPYERDRSVAGGRLRTTAGVARKGVGLHAQAIIEYEVPTDAKWFITEVAVDEATNEYASLQGRISIQGGKDQPWQEVAVTKVLRRGDQPELIRVPLQEATSLRLEALPAEDGNRGDLADWLYARFIISAK